jgi:hypothetical protein
MSDTAQGPGPREPVGPPTEPEEVLAVEPPGGIPTESKFFFGLGAFLTLIGLVYAVTTRNYGSHTEYAGTLALLAGAGFAFFFGTFLLLTVRRIQEDVEALEEARAAGTDVSDVLFLPAQSIWPIGLGFGLSLMAAGVALGLWVMIPGLALFVHSLIGFAQQSRRRQ